jgi:hypothetical protein
MVRDAHPVTGFHAESSMWRRAAWFVYLQLVTQ